MKRTLSQLKKWYLCYEEMVYVGGNTYAREVRDWGKCPYDTEEEANEVLKYWKCVDPVQYAGMFVYPM